MSYNESIKVACPKCKLEQAMTIWNSINVSLDPELRTHLMESTINSFTCSECGGSCQLDTDLLYHDMECQFAVQYYPAQLLEDKDFFTQFNADSISKNDDLSITSTTKAPRYLYFPHIVFDLEEMKRYIVFREKLFAVNAGRSGED